MALADRYIRIDESEIARHDVRESDLPHSWVREGREAIPVKLWGALYGAIWVVLFEILLGLWPSPPVVVSYLHVVLGLVIVGIAYSNRTHLVATRVPGRVKRIAGVTLAFSILMVVLGLMLELSVGTAWSFVGFTFFQLVLIFHVVFALAIITQMAAVAIAYDMWEEHEFEKETAPGEIPPAPSPASRGD